MAEQKKDKTEQYLEYIIEYMGQLQQQAKPKERTHGEELLDIFENKTFYIDEWNTPEHVKPEDISAINLVGNILDNSLAAVVGDLFPEAIGYFLGGEKGRTGRETSLYEDAKNRASDKLARAKAVWKPAGGAEEAGGKKGAQEGVVPKEHKYLGGVSPEYAATIKTLMDLVREYQINDAVTEYSSASYGRDKKKASSDKNNVPDFATHQFA